MSLNRELVAPCGIHCEPCPMYRARTDEALRRSLGERYGAPAEIMRCEGCRPLGGSPVALRGDVCPTYSCANAKGVEVCHQCDAFPCGRLQPAADRAAHLPHNTKLMSLLLMKRDGLESWAEQYPGIQRRYFEGRMVVGHGPQLSEEG